MKVLVDKVEEYRSTEDAMRAALLTAQKMADSMVAEAERRKSPCSKTPKARPTARSGALRDGRAGGRRLTAAKAETADFLAPRARTLRA